MTEGAEEPSPEDLRQQELAQLRKYAQEQSENGFVWVYRGEGEFDESLVGPNQKTGMWFTTSFAGAQDHIVKINDRGAKKTRLIAVAIPKSMLDKDGQIQREGRMPVGTDTVVVHFRDEMLDREVEEPILEAPTPDIYVSQFKIAQEDMGNPRGG